MKSSFFKYFINPKSIFILFIALFSFSSELLNAEEPYLEEMKIDSSTKLDENSTS